MSYLIYRKWTAITGGTIGAVVGVSVGLDNWIAPIVVIITGAIFLAFLRRRVKDIVADERTYAIAYKAARLTVAVGRHKHGRYRCNITCPGPS